MDNTYTNLLYRIATLFLHFYLTFWGNHQTKFDNDRTIVACLNLPKSYPLDLDDILTDHYYRIASL